MHNLSFTRHTCATTLQLVYHSNAHTVYWKFFQFLEIKTVVLAKCGYNKIWILFKTQAEWVWRVDDVIWREIEFKHVLIWLNTVRYDQKPGKLYFSRQLTRCYIFASAKVVLVGFFLWFIEPFSYEIDSCIKLDEHTGCYLDTSKLETLCLFFFYKISFCLES